MVFCDLPGLPVKVLQTHPGDEVIATDAVATKQTTMCASNWISRASTSKKNNRNLSFQNVKLPHT